MEQSGFLGAYRSALNLGSYSVMVIAQSMIGLSLSDPCSVGSLSHVVVWSDGSDSERQPSCYCTVAAVTLYMEQRDICTPTSVSKVFSGNIFWLQTWYVNDLAREMNECLMSMGFFIARFHGRLLAMMIYFLNLHGAYDRG